MEYWSAAICGALAFAAASLMGRRALADADGRVHGFICFRRNSGLEEWEEGSWNRKSLRSVASCLITAGGVYCIPWIPWLWLQIVLLSLSTVIALSVLSEMLSGSWGAKVTYCREIGNSGKYLPVSGPRPTFPRLLPGLLALAVGIGAYVGAEWAAQEYVLDYWGMTALFAGAVLLYFLISALGMHFLTRRRLAHRERNRDDYCQQCGGRREWIREQVTNTTHHGGTLYTRSTESRVRQRCTRCGG